MYFHYFAMHDIKLHVFFIKFFYSIVEIAMGFIFFLNNFFYSIVKTSMDHIPWRFSMLTHNSYCFYDFVQYVCNAIKIQETPSLLHCQATSRLPGRSQFYHTPDVRSPQICHRFDACVDCSAQINIYLHKYTNKQITSFSRNVWENPSASDDHS